MRQRRMRCWSCSTAKSVSVATAPGLSSFRFASWMITSSSRASSSESISELAYASNWTSRPAAKLDDGRTV
jgi:hypothetical protein